MGMSRVGLQILFSLPSCTSSPGTLQSGPGGPRCQRSATLLLPSWSLCVCALRISRQWVPGASWVALGVSGYRPWQLLMQFPVCETSGQGNLPSASTAGWTLGWLLGCGTGPRRCAPAFPARAGPAGARPDCAGGFGDGHGLVQKGFPKEPQMGEHQTIACESSSGVDPPHTLKKKPNKIRKGLPPGVFLSPPPPAPQEGRLEVLSCSWGQNTLGFAVS